jgi:hypothetical protein
MQTYSDLSNAFLAKVILTLDTTTTIGKVILQAERTRGYRQNLGSDTTCDAPKSAPCELQQSRHNSHDVALETPTKRNVHVATYTLGGWNQGSNITQIHDGTHKRIYNHKDSTSQESKYTYKDPNHT